MILSGSSEDREIFRSKFAEAVNQRLAAQPVNASAGCMLWSSGGRAILLSQAGYSDSVEKAIKGWLRGFLSEFVRSFPDAVWGFDPSGRFIIFESEDVKANNEYRNTPLLSFWTVKSDGRLHYSYLAPVGVISGTTDSPNDLHSFIGLLDRR